MVVTAMAANVVRTHTDIPLDWEYVVWPTDRTFDLKDSTVR